MRDVVRDTDQSLRNGFFSKYMNRWHSHTGKDDIQVGIFSYHVWTTLGWHDIKQRYRRSVLGPFWFTLSTLIMVGVLGVLYSTLLNQEIKDYLPYLGVGLVVWQYISTCFNEGSNTFISYGFIMKQARMPITTHVMRVVWRNFIILLHSLPVVIFLMIAFGHNLTIDFLWVVPGLIVVLLNTVWISIVLSILCARFRDILPIVANIIQVAFFFTPIMWSKDLLKDRSWAADINPFHHMIEIVRAPILGSELELLSWVFAIVTMVVGFLFAHYLMVKCRDRVPYWL
ncbi:ABC transporter permease [Vibrio tubiashii]|uniref:ABC transporter permease n=1 Tax=Vibrio tubiashii TaxID=29498 RepID=UPI00234E9777|nr:ABC transporter permease [Vibrio tubiashii]WCP67272.1 ABC transporter permease [Vibrio tubiashii]